MSFLNKFKKEFEGLSISQQGGQLGPGAPSHSAPPQSYGYGQPPPPSQSSYQNQYPRPPPQDHYQGQYGRDGSGYGPPSPQPYSAYQPGPHHMPPEHGLSAPPGASPYPPHPSQADSAPVHSGGPCPRPPQWVPHWSEQNRQWYYVETTGRSTWDAPTHLPPLPDMPSYSPYNSGHGTDRQDVGYRDHHQNAPSYGGGPTHAPEPPPAPAEQKSSRMPSNSTMLAAAGGFAAGGVVGYLTHDVLDKRKKKRRHGTQPSDFSDFSKYPDMEVGLDCNVCDQPISGPYAHCAQCDDGDYDLCRDCLAQGTTCDGGHRLVKVYPPYFCDGCDQRIKGDFYHCAVCNDGDWDVCQRCLDRGVTCNADGGHNLAKLYIPVPKFKNAGGAGGAGVDDDSSDSD